jgi:hypothetical protein
MPPAPNPPDAAFSSSSSSSASFHLAQSIVMKGFLLLD